MKVFLDANLILDLILERDLNGFFFEMESILDLVDDGKVSLYCASASFFFMDFILAKKLSNKDVKKALKDILGYVKALPTFEENILEGLDSVFKDKEDSFQFYTALNLEGTFFFLTANLKDFLKVKHERVKLLNPKQFLKAFYREP